MKQQIITDIISIHELRIMYELSDRVLRAHKIR